MTFYLKRLTLFTQFFLTNHFPPHDLFHHSCDCRLMQIRDTMENILPDSRMPNKHKTQIKTLILCNIIAYLREFHNCPIRQQIFNYKKYLSILTIIPCNQVYSNYETVYLGTLTIVFTNSLQTNGQIPALDSQDAIPMSATTSITNNKEVN